MKKLLETDGRTVCFDTEASFEMVSWSSRLEKIVGKEETLYKTRDGLFFLVSSTTAYLPYEAEPWWKTTPELRHVCILQAMKLVQKNCEQDDFIRLFCSTAEQSVVSLNADTRYHVATWRLRCDSSGVENILYKSDDNLFFLASSATEYLPGEWEIFRKSPPILRPVSTLEAMEMIEEHCTHDVFIRLFCVSLGQLYFETWRRRFESGPFLPVCR